MTIDPHQPRCLGLKSERFSPFRIIVAACAIVFLAVPLHAQSDDAPAASGKAADMTPDNTSDNASPPPADADWYEVDGTGAGPTDGQVLEVPQVVNPADSDVATGNAGDTNGGQAEAANGNDGDENTAQAPDEIGSIGEYQTENSEMATTGTYFAPVPMQSFANRGSTVLNPPINRRIGGMFPASPIIVRPGRFSPLPPTSPMLIPPRGSGAIPGGWWTPAHR
jgi:hypothetical protein